MILNKIGGISLCPTPVTMTKFRKFTSDSYLCCYILCSMISIKNDMMEYKFKVLHPAESSLESVHIRREFRPEMQISLVVYVGRKSVFWWKAIVFAQ